MMAINTWLIENKRRITYAAFGVLFIIRALAGYRSATSQEDVSRFYPSFFIVSLIGITVFILANKDDLSKFNIDKYVIYTLILSGVILFITFPLSLPGIIAIICALLVRRVLYVPKTESHRPVNFGTIFRFTILGITLEVLLRLFTPESLRYPNYYLHLSAGEIFVLVSIVMWNVMLEDVLFRSILWGILGEWKLNATKIIVIQAFLFWLVHLDLILTSSHGIPVLIFGLWTGFLVSRAKSLTQISPPILCITLLQD